MAQSFGSKKAAQVPLSVEGSLLVKNRIDPILKHFRSWVTVFEPALIEVVAEVYRFDAVVDLLLKLC